MRAGTESAHPLLKTARHRLRQSRIGGPPAFSAALSGAPPVRCRRVSRISPQVAAANSATRYRCGGMCATARSGGRRPGRDGRYPPALAGGRTGPRRKPATRYGGCRPSWGSHRTAASPAVPAGPAASPSADHPDAHAYSAATAPRACSRRSARSIHSAVSFSCVLFWPNRSCSAAKSTRSSAWS